MKDVAFSDFYIVHSIYDIVCWKFSYGVIKTHFLFLAPTGAQEEGILDLRLSVRLSVRPCTLCILAL